MAYQAPYSGLAQVLAMQGRGPDTQLLHVTPMELRRLEAMAPNGRLPRNPETGLPEAGIFDGGLGDILSFALPIAGSAFLGPAIAPFVGGNALIGGAIGSGLGRVGAGLLQGDSIGDSLIAGGLSGLMSYGLGSVSDVFAPSGGRSAAPAQNFSVADQLATGSTFDPMMEANAGLSATDVAGMTGESPGFFGRLGEQLSKPVAPGILGDMTYGGALAAGGTGLLASGLLEEPYQVAEVDEFTPRTFDYDMEEGAERGRARARTPRGYYSPSELLQMATTRGYNPPFLAAEGGRIPYPYSDGGGYDDPYGDTYGPGDPYGGKTDDDVSEPSSGVGVPGQAAGSGSTGSGFFSGLNEPIADLGLPAALTPTPMSLGLTALSFVPGPIGIGAGLLGLGRTVASLMGSPSVSPSGQTQVYGMGNQNVDAYGNPVGSTSYDMAAMAVPGMPGLQDPMGVYGGFTSSGQGIGAVSDTYGDEFGESTPDMGSDGGDSTGGNGGVGGDVGDDWSDIRLKRGVQYLGDASGLRKYSWNYVWGGPRKVGVMAHELLGTKYADAVRVVDGYMRVDYSQLPAEVRTV